MSKYEEIRGIWHSQKEAELNCSPIKDRIKSEHIHYLIYLIEQMKGIIKAQDELLACYRLNRQPPERIFDILEEKPKLLKLLE